MDESRGFPENSSRFSALSLVLKKLGVLFLFRSAATLATCTTSPRGSFPGFGFFFFVLSVNLGNDLLDSGVSVGLDKVAKEIRKTEQVTESTDRIIFL